MLVRMILAFFAILLLARSGNAAEDCQSLGFEGREQIVRQAPSCDKANASFAACAYGAGGDTSLAQIVIEKCEGGFLNTLSKAQRRSYDRGMKRCEAKYEHEDGTMYRAMAAGCRANLAQSYAHKFGKVR